MLTIWRWELKIDGFTEIEMPANANVLSVEPHMSGPSLFAVCDPTAPKVTRTFVMVGTGGAIDPSMGEHHYLGTVQAVLEAGEKTRLIVAHAFEVQTHSTPLTPLVGEEDTDGTQG